MKKVVLAVLLGLVLCSVCVFAEHPGGWGLGVMGHGGYGWGRSGMGGVALSLKAPRLPVYWGINLELYSDFFGVGLSGDYYLIDKMLIPKIGLGWYLGLGGFFTFGRYNPSYDYNAWTYLSFGGRLPIGLSWQLLKAGSIGIEIFGEVIPSLGLGLRLWNSKYNDYHVRASDSHVGVGGGIDFGLGVRIWL
ncbi:MAG: hypothetical protein LBI86_07495 [Treponema sp.]|jgi:hypothetical protein|nr:hypothetical protein [Treponema sp.]